MSYTENTNHQTAILCSSHHCRCFCDSLAPVSASTHRTNESTRRRKLLLHGREIAKLTGLTERKGYTLIAVSMYWVRGKVKVQIGLGKGKKEYDKRASIKERDWQRDKARRFVSTKNCMWKATMGLPPASRIGNDCRLAHYQ